MCEVATTGYRCRRSWPCGPLGASHWVLEVEHLLSGSWAQEGEVVSNVTVGERLDSWRKQMSRHLTDGTLCDLEQECLTQFLQQLSNLRPHLVQCYDRAGFPRTNNEMERSIRGRKHVLPPQQWSQELEQVAVALWALGGVLRVVGTGCNPAATTRRAALQARSRAVASASSRDHRRATGATDALSFPSQTRSRSRFA
jgi:hypothetical protein